MRLRTMLRQTLPYIAAIAVFWVISTLYFAPQFAGNTLQMNDVTMYEGMKRDISDHRAATGEDPQWTGGMFGGMPAYLITVKYPAMILRNGAQWLLGLLGEPAALMFLAMAGFWLMLLMCGVNTWLAIPFAIAYGLSTYNILIIEAGHITKMRAMGYAPMLVGAVFWTLRRGVWLGGALSALFGALLIAASHHQITYYFLLVVIALWINELVCTYRDRAKIGWHRFCIATGVLAAAGVMAVGANFTHIWYTLEHAPDTTRGGSEQLATDPGSADTADSGVTGGLDLDYATQWSYGVGESLNMLIPNLRGGASFGGFAPDGPVAGALRAAGYPRHDAADLATQLPGYWGTQPFTGGPTYIGAVVVFMFVLGMFVLPGRTKWWILGVSIFALLLAWGRNAMWFTELSFAVLPGYNKFRTVAMALAVLQWSVPVVAALTAQGLWPGGVSEAQASGRPVAAIADRKQFTKGLLWSLALVGGISLLFALGGGAIFDFSAAGDSQFGGIPGLIDAMHTERAALLRADSWRSLLFVSLTAAVVWMWVSRRNIKHWIAVAALSGLVLADLVPVDLRFLSHADFRTPASVEATPDEADLQIMADHEPGFRVLNTENPFNEAYTSLFHRSVGGYHAAKLRRYQDVIDRYLSRFHLGVINMLNTKYFLVADPATGERVAEPNPDAFGAAWFASEVKWVKGATAELDALEKADLRHQAIVDERFTASVGSAPEATSTGAGSIKLTEYRPNYLRYESSSPTDRVAVFSEIYYDKGWTAYVDGNPAPYFRADYILRAMTLPAGDHVVEWRFRAPRFAAVEGVTLACSVVILLWLAATIFFDRRKRLASRNS